jgi:glycolate oxidase iron-sulfur subunit
MLRTDPAYAQKAARVAERVRDISEYLATLPLEQTLPQAEMQPEAGGLVVAYQAACSLQHGQRVVRQPKELLAHAGFVVKDIPEGHLCCGSAGTYNMLQPAIAARLGARKAAAIARVAPDIIATGNVGCMFQIAQATGTPIVHTVELLDWAHGGPRPAALKDVARRAVPVQQRETVT